MADSARIARGPRELVVHDWQANALVDVGSLAKFLSSTFGIDASVVGGAGGIRRAGAGGPLESCRVHDTRRPFWRQRALADGGDTGAIALYDGHELLRGALAIAGSGAAPGGALHIMVTDILVGTYDDNDARYHARPIVAANPSLVSTSAAIWGPARSRRYYEEIMECRMTGADPAGVEAAHAADHLTEGDSRMGRVIEGYAMQAVVYAMTGEGFCADQGCRLHDAHWQADMLAVQGAESLCAAHRALIGGLT